MHWVGTLISDAKSALRLQKNEVYELCTFMHADSGDDTQHWGKTMLWILSNNETGEKRAAESSVVGTIGHHL